MNSVVVVEPGVRALLVLVCLELIIYGLMALRTAYPRRGQDE